MPLPLATVGPAEIFPGRYYPADSGLTADADARIATRVQRALNRLGEGDYDLYILAVREHRAAGYRDDVADALALNEVYGDDSWTRFRK